MITALVGYTGFVGSNLASQKKFDLTYNSKNIEESYESNPDLLIFAGVRAEKFIANKDPELDYKNILTAIDTIKRINPKKIVLISTVDVYGYPVDVDEDSEIETNDRQAYGVNRYYLEEWVEENCDDHLIIRLPGLYGDNIKKNIIYDLLHPIPSMLSADKLGELINTDTEIKRFYVQSNVEGFFQCRELTSSEKIKLENYLNRVNFSSLSFTDSRGVFQFYNLSNLWRHIAIALKNDIKKINLATEPVSVSELIWHVERRRFTNEFLDSPPHYDFKTKHFSLFNGKDGYVFEKKFVLDDIKQFIEKHRQ